MFGQEIYLMVVFMHKHIFYIPLLSHSAAQEEHLPLSERLGQEEPRLALVWLELTSTLLTSFLPCLQGLRRMQSPFSRPVLITAQNTCSGDDDKVHLTSLPSGN